MFECQTRDLEGATIQHPSVDEAFKFAKENKLVWKVSWEDPITKNRLRFVRDVNDSWMYEPLLSD